MSQADPFDAMSRSFNALQGAWDQGTRNQAGRAYAGGDARGAANALASGGMVQEAADLNYRGQQQQNLISEDDRAKITQRVQFLGQGLSALEGVPEASRNQVFEQLAPQLIPLVGADVVEQMRAAPKTDQALAAFRAAIGAEADRAGVPSGYRRAPGGNLEYIPGGPEDPKNQRPIVTPYGIMMPPGAALPQMPGAQPQSLGSTIPPGWSAAPPRPNQASPAPAAGGAERSQPVGVSFRSSQEAQSAITSLAPGVRVTSGARSASDNRRVGGATGSFHLQDRARDLVPPAGMTMAQLATKMRQAGFRVLNEGDHVHVSW